jgi:hypothetical protein
VLEALVRKTELIREQLGSAGQVIAGRITDRLAREGIVRPAALAREVAGEGADPLVQAAVEEMDDATERRRARQARELDDLRKALEASRLDPAQPAFSTAGWPEALDSLRGRRRGRGERLKDWRADVPLKALSFSPAITAEGADAEGVIQLHLEHCLVRRLLSRFLSQGFQSGLSRACVVVGPGAQPRVVLLGRLALYGPGAARLHEEVLTVTAAWNEAGRGTVPLRPFGTRGEETTLNQVEAALRQPRRPPASAAERVRAWAARGAADLEPALRRRAAARREDVALDLAERGSVEAEALRRLLLEQRDRLVAKEAELEDMQLGLFRDDEALQRRRDRQHWRRKISELEEQIEREPARVREGYTVRADRVEILGPLYLWPGSN